MNYIKMSMDKHGLRLAIILISIAVFFSIGTAVTYASDSGINEKPTLKQLRDKYNDAGIAPKGESVFSIPVNTNTYTPATLAPQAYSYAEKYLNFMRFQAGLGAITLDDSLNANAAQGALIMARNGVFAHEQNVPEGISEADAKAGRYATNASNISSASAWPYANNMSIIEDAILGQMQDDSGSNLNRVGHRRWLLKPSTSTFGIGSALLVNPGDWNEAYSVVRVMNRTSDPLYDASFGTVQVNNSTDYDFVAWPASGYMLNEVFNNDTPWSVHINESRYQPIGDDVSVTITRQSDGQVWTMDSSSPNSLSDGKINSNYFKISNNSNTIIGEGHCLIFCPDPNELGSGKLKGIYNVEITGLKDKNTGTPKTIDYSVNFVDLKPSMNEMEISLNQDAVEYTGDALEPAVTVLYDGTPLTEGTDYRVSYKDNIEVTDSAVATITGIGKYEGSVEKPFTITHKRINLPSANTELIYTGKSQQGINTSTDYSIDGGTATNAGSYTATLTLTDTRNTTWYDGSTSAKTISWRISPKPISEEMIAIRPNEKEYNGNRQKPEVDVKDGDSNLVPGSDYTLTNEGGTEIGEYSVKVSGKGNYASSATKEFRIIPKTLTDEMVVLEKNTFTFTGSTQKPEHVSVVNGSSLLTEGTDYTIENEGRRDVGTYKVKVTGRGNYKGTIEKEYTITEKDLTEDMISLDKESSPYTGEAQTPSIIVIDNGTPLSEGTDYTLNNNSGTDAGEYIIRIEGKGNYKGKAEKIFTITPLSVKDKVDIEVDQGSKYTGKEITPEVSVAFKENGKKLTVDKDYTLKYQNNINVGEASVKVMFKGNYTDSVDAPFTIGKGINSVTVKQNGWIEGEASPAPVTTATFGGSEAIISYSTQKDGEYTSTKPKKNGTYYVQAYIAGTDNYEEAYSQPVAFVISKRSLTSATTTVTVANPTYTGKALSPVPT